MDLVLQVAEVVLVVAVVAGKRADLLKEVVVTEEMEVAEEV